MRLVISDGDGEPVDVIHNPEDFDVDNYLHRGRLRGYIHRAVTKLNGRRVVISTEEGEAFRSFEVTPDDLDGQGAGAFMADLGRGMRDLESYRDAEERAA